MAICLLPSPFGCSHTTRLCAVFRGPGVSCEVLWSVLLSYLAGVTMHCKGVSQQHDRIVGMTTSMLCSMCMRLCGPEYRCAPGAVPLMLC